MATFALVHGAWHGAWCWDRLVPELKMRDHQVVAVDLPSDDVTASFDDYADVVCAALGDTPARDLILVGHSLGGMTIPLVAARRPLRRLVYLCALLPQPGRSLGQQMAEDGAMLDPDYARGLSRTDPDLRTWVDEERAREHMFGDCDEATATAAIARLRPQATYPYRLPHPPDALAAVASTYVLCTQDRMVNPEWSRRTAPDRVGADVEELPGSHSPFLSRPGQLADVLDRLADV
jgi:pimeloyl-ACP methyl ester carboxylesterase